MRTSILVLMATAVVALGFVAAHAQSSWDVPDDAKAMANPVAASPDAVAAGKGLYDKRCVTCHGPEGKGDGAATQYLQVEVADLSTAEARERMTDGEIFYKVSKGKAPMPKMEGKLSEEEIWQIVHFVRSLQAE